MKKQLVISITILFLGIAVAPLTQGIITKESNHPIKDGNTLYVGGTGEGNYTSIQEAINDTANGDTVFVFDKSSPYYENIIVNKSIFLIGENRDTTVIDGGGDENVIYINADRVYISRFTIQNGGLEYPYGGINIRSNYSTISCNNIENNFYGLDMFYSNNNYIFKNNITNNNQCGIYLERSSNNNISGNFINTQPFNGVGLYNLSTNNTIFKNTIINNKYSGVRITKCCSNFIISNMISKNLVGVRVEFSTNTKILNNNFIKNIFKEAHHLGNNFLPHNNIWDENYWNRPRVLPKPIFGRTGLFFILIPWINFDWNPAKEPYDL